MPLGALMGPIGLKAAVLVMETSFLVSRLRVTKETQKELLFLKIFVFDEFRGPLKGALLGPKGP